VAVIHYQGLDLAVDPTESVLDCLRRNAVPILYGCKQGVCHACKLRLVRGSVSARSQEPLRDTWRAQGYFLACRCFPSEDLTLEPTVEKFNTRAEITSVDKLDDTVVRIRLRPEQPFPYRPGQSIAVTGPDGIEGRAPLVSLSAEEEIEIHTGMPVPAWAAGGTVTIEGPFGDCFYVAEDQNGSLLFAAVAGAAASLYPVVRDALLSHHSGPMWFFHESPGSYLTDHLRGLAAAYANFHYVPLEEQMEAAIVSQFPALQRWRAYLSASPERLQTLRRALFRAGADMKDIHAS